jgi:hypothetical protein
MTQPDHWKYTLYTLRNVTLLAPANPMGSVQEVRPIAQSPFRMLVYRHDNCLDVVGTVAFMARPVPDFGERYNPWRMSVLPSYYLGGSRDSGAASFHQVFQLRPLPRNQELRRRAVQTGLIELPDGRAEGADRAGFGFSIPTDHHSRRLWAPFTGFLPTGR